MKVRSSRISASIARAISQDDIPGYSFISRLWRLLISFFTVFHLSLVRFRPADFIVLRQQVWQLDEEEYLDSFRPTTRASGSRRHRRGKDPDSQLVPVGNLGYSGSTFFTTTDGKYLIKSLPRRFEYDFFTAELHENYVMHMKVHPKSMLVRITDTVFTPHLTLGGMLGAAPTHHIVMENLLYGQPSEPEERDKWETYDLKPHDYFFPERDIADGRLAPASIKDKLVDEFPESVRVPLLMKEDLLTQLNADTQLLAAKSAVDYSLFLVRFPGPSVRGSHQHPVPHIHNVSHPWRMGVDDVAGEWTYRAVVLDFFWAKSRMRAKAMTGLVNTYNVVADQGPMSITAEPTEYRQRFMRMADALVEGVRDPV